MFLSRRSKQAEYFDAERPAVELVDFFNRLGRVNRLFAFADPFQQLVPEMCGDTRCRTLSVLDLGAGDGTLGKVLSGWAQGRGWHWCFTNLDLSFPSLRLNPGSRNLVGSACELPFRQNSFDVVIASQMTHHLSDEQVIGLLREAWRVGRCGMVLADLHRTFLVYSTLWLLLQLQRQTGPFYDDALLSVKRSWRPAELEALARLAGVPRAQVSVRSGWRILLAASKTAS